jgi:hypothetical protein
MVSVKSIRLYVTNSASRFQGALTSNPKLFFRSYYIQALYSYVKPRCHFWSIGVCTIKEKATSLCWRSKDYIWRIWSFFYASQYRNGGIAWQHLVPKWLPFLDGFRSGAFQRETTEAMFNILFGLCASQLLSSNFYLTWMSVGVNFGAKQLGRIYSVCCGVQAISYHTLFVPDHPLN